MDHTSYTIRGRDIHFPNGTIVTFAYPIAQSLLFYDVLVVRLEIPFDTIYNENVFGIDLSGNIRWQISPCYAKTEDGAFGDLSAVRGLVVVSNYRGLVVYLNPRTGEVRHKEEQIH